MFQKTQERRDEILSQDRADRAGFGGIRTYASHSLRSEVMGGTLAWWLNVTYSDGTTRTWEPTKKA